jgi:undecaprenyl-diphosphatase
MADRPFVVLLAACAILLSGFAKLASEVMEGDTRAFDERLLLAFRTPGDVSELLGPRWMHEMVRDFTALGSTGVLTIVTLAAVGFLVMSGRRRTSVFVLGCVLGGVGLGNALKIGFSRPRPELVPHSVEVFTNSFPSGHAMMSAVVYLTLGNLIARTEERASMRFFILAVATFLTVLVGISRIYLGVHWPTDVLAGWTLGACWALLCWTAMAWLQSHGRIEGQASG